MRPSPARLLPANAPAGLAADTPLRDTAPAVHDRTLAATPHHIPGTHQQISKPIRDTFRDSDRHLADVTKHVTKLSFWNHGLKGEARWRGLQTAQSI
ncbi:hypothetical protein GCM10010470_47490 [Saccharopolyspora taberi]|uniref:Uncharacterized protein n=1 Tax=Saccharopolyspora taberi TaxID=60895 RepID=A0ABN3VHU0_9PSEU